MKLEQFSKQLNIPYNHFPFGVAEYTPFTNKIKINTNLIEMGYEDFLCMSLLHEYAHQISFIKFFNYFCACDKWGNLYFHFKFKDLVYIEQVAVLYSIRKSLQLGNINLIKEWYKNICEQCNDLPYLLVKKKILKSKLWRKVQKIVKE